MPLVVGYRVCLIWYVVVGVLWWVFYSGCVMVGVLGWVGYCGMLRSMCWGGCVGVGVIG